MDGSYPHGFRIRFNVLLRYQLLENLTTWVFPTLIEVLFFARFVLLRTSLT